MIKDISPAFFTNLYHSRMEEEKRQNVKRYMQFFYGSFLYERGDKDESTRLLEDIVNNTLLDTAHEKLFLGRLFQQLAVNYEDAGKKSESDNMMYSYYTEYPQLIPFSGLKMKMKLNVSGVSDEMTDQIRSELEDCNIRWINTPDF